MKCDFQNKRHVVGELSKRSFPTAPCSGPALFLMWSSRALKIGLAGAAFFLCHFLVTVQTRASSSDAHARSSRAGMSRACMRVPIVYCSSIETRLLAVSLDTTRYSSERALVSGCIFAAGTCAICCRKLRSSTGCLPRPSSRSSSIFRSIPASLPS